MNRLTTAEFIKRSKEKYPGKFTYLNTVYTGKKNTVILTCPIHGDFEVTAQNHMYHIAGCPKCSSSHSPTTEEWIKRAKEKFPQYDYSKVNYVNNKTKVIIVCPKHGEFSQSPSNFLIHCGCSVCQKEKKEEEYSNYFFKEAKRKFGNKFSYLTEKVFHNKKIKIICPIHGEFNQLPQVHLNAKYGCPKCQSHTSTLKTSTEEWIEKARLIHGNKYDYSITIFNGSNNKIEYICPKHGRVIQYAYRHLNGSGCRKCSSSKGEEKISNILESMNIPFESQKSFEDLKNINNLKYDFYLPKQNIVIEFNGIQHYSSRAFRKTRKEFLIQKHRDWLKRKYAKKNNLKLIIIPYWEFENIETILKFIDIF